MKNKCEECWYFRCSRDVEGDYDYSCDCGLDCDKYISEDGSCGCHYSEGMLKLLNKWHDFEYSEQNSYRLLDEFVKLEELKEKLKQKQENNEKIDYWDKVTIESYQKHYEMLSEMEHDYMRCQFLRFFKENDPKGKLRRYLKKTGQYPYWIHDLFSADRGERNE